MDAYILKRGKGSIELKKSRSLVGLRPSSAADLSQMLPALGPNIKWADTGKSMSGFRMVNVEGPESIDAALDQLRQNELVHVGSHVYHTPQSSVPYIPTGKLTLRFQPGTAEEDKQSILDRYKLQVLEARVKDKADGSKQETYIVATTAESVNPLKVALELQQQPETITVAEPDLSTPGKLAHLVLPLDSLFKEQWHLQNTGVQFGTSLGLKQGADARVVQAWEKLGSFGLPTCIVAVIDDGFDLSHPDLSGPDKITAPWDFVSLSGDPSPRKMAPFGGDYHGTACAGVAIGSVNGTGIVGVAPACPLMPVRWSANISDDSIEGWFAYVTRNGAWVVNCSWGAATSDYILSTLQHEAIESCAREGRQGKGCVVVFAAGNSNMGINDPDNGTMNGFAIHPDVIAVAASTSRDERANYSNYGNEISVCAPSDGQGGRGMLTADVRGKFLFQGIEYYAGYDPSDFTRAFGGTSGAAPLVAGVCALMLSADPALTSAQVKSILQKTARRIGDGIEYENGHSPLYGHGCVNAEAAISHILNLQQQ